MGLVGQVSNKAKTVFQSICTNVNRANAQMGEKKGKKWIGDVPSMPSPSPDFTLITSLFLSEYFVLRLPDLNKATGSLTG